jgi:hypothetical protein
MPCKKEEEMKRDFNVAIEKINEENYQKYLQSN